MFDFDTVGEKICILSKIFFISSVIGSVVEAIFIWVNEKNFWIGLIFLLAGPISAYIISLFIYEIGVRHINIKEINYYINQTINTNNKILRDKPSYIIESTNKVTKTNSKVMQTKTSDSIEKDWKCEECGTLNSENSDYCSLCSSGRPKKDNNK